VHDSLMWKVPPKAASGLIPSRRRGRRDSSRLTLSWAPSGLALTRASASSAGLDELDPLSETSERSVHGATLDSTVAAPTRFSPSGVVYRTSPSGVIEVTCASVTSVAPASR